ncbi:MAG: tyrosine--tRNA ligase [Candidatus Njordarchaeota archaeon]
MNKSPVMKAILNNVAEPLDEFVITMNDLEKLIESKEKIVSYCGYEPSGPIHIGYFPTLFKAKEIGKIGIVKILLADYHAYLNNKGPLDIIQDLSTNYWIPVFKALGVNAKYILGSEFQGTKEYITDLFTLSRRMSMKRAIRAVTIILRQKEEIQVGAAIYPIMQVLDIIYLDLNLAFGGTDQRKIHALIRDLLTHEAVKELKRKPRMPVCIHLPMILGLKPGEKMSSSKPETHIAIHDTPEAIKRKLRKAYCPPETADPNKNPIFSILKHVIMPYSDDFTVNRPEKYGGPITYTKFEDIARDYIDKNLHPLDLKNAVADWIISQLRSVHKLLEKDPEILRPVYNLQKWNYDRGYISKDSWKMLKDAYDKWLR